MVFLKIFGIFLVLFLKLSFSDAFDCENLDCNKTSWIKIFELLEKYEISAEYESFQSEFDQQNQTLDNTTTFENNTSNSTSGEEEGYAEIYDHIDFVQRIMFGIVIIFEVFTVLFLFNEFSKRDSEFRGAYYVMLSVGMCTDIMGHTSELVQFYFYDKVVGTEGYEALTYFMEFQIYHGAVFMVTMNVTFIFERVTEIWYKHLYNRIWNKVGTTLILIINFLLPLVIGGYIIFQPKCVYYFTGCEPQLKNIALIFISFTFVAAFLMTIIVWKLFHQRSKTNKVSHIDRAFIIESLIGLILLTIYQTSMTIWTYVWQIPYRNFDFFKPLEDFAIFCYLTLHVIEIYVLVTYPPFRNGMLKFYTFGHWKKNVVTVLSKQEQA